MRGVMRAGLAVAATVLVLAATAGGFLVSGQYDIGADDHHTRIVLTLITELRERSIDVRARDLEVPDLDAAARVATGGRRYAELCAACHFAPGTAHSLLRAGLYPHPPDLAAADRQEPRRAFWVVKHGIKMSAMPAWGRSLDDATIWDIVAFVERLPTMSAATYQQLSGAGADPQ